MRNVKGKVPKEFVFATSHWSELSPMATIAAGKSGKLNLCEGPIAQTKSLFCCVRRKGSLKADNLPSFFHLQNHTNMFPLIINCLFLSFSFFSPDYTSILCIIVPS